MSIFIVIDDNPPSQIASNSGWSDFTKWVDGLGEVDALDHLCTYGWNDDADEVMDDLEGVIDNGNATPDQKSIAQNILDLLKANPGADTLVVNNGMVADDSDDEDETDDEET